MIHQLIFAAPKPGLTEEEFQHYWLDVHAVRYASKIPQIARYLVAPRVPLTTDTGEPAWGGAAEIWLNSDADQLASLQTPEFLDGARADEPNWAAFWRTLVMDTEPHELVPDSRPAGTVGVKLFVLVKRAEGLPLDRFRTESAGLAEPAAALPGLRRYVLGLTRDGAYGIGEATLDAAHQLWFDDAAALEAAVASPEWDRYAKSLDALVEERYVHRFAGRENWVIGPRPRR